MHLLNRAALSNVSAGLLKVNGVCRLQEGFSSPDQRTFTGFRSEIFNLRNAEG